METKEYEIKEEKVDQDLEEWIKEGFSCHALEAVGHEGDMRGVTFVARDGDKLLGAVVAKTFWGGLHIKNLIIAKEYRVLGIGKALMERVFEKGKELGCRFAFVETMSFQALDFYKKIGFVEEFSRSGYDKGCTFHYLKKEF